MKGYSKTTGKEYKKESFKCACGHIYHENDDGKCPACGSEDRVPYQQTVASLDDEQKQDKEDSNES